MTIHHSESEILALFKTGPDSESELAFRILKGSALTLLVAWTIVANFLVFVVLYKNPRLQTVPNLLVGNLAFSDFSLALLVLPLSSVYAIAQEWVFGRVICETWLSCDILCCTASIWNLSMIGLDRYWAITSPVAYLTKRTKEAAMAMIGAVWLLSALISLAPFFGWKYLARQGNYLPETIIYNSTTNHTFYLCDFLNLKSYTVYSATGSFFVPCFLMFYVYFKIYHAFARHKARQIFRQKVIKKHIESTILHGISNVLPTSDELAKSTEGEGDDDDGVPTERSQELEQEKGEPNNNNTTSKGLNRSSTASKIESDEENLSKNEQKQARLDAKQENQQRTKDEKSPSPAAHLIDFTTQSRGLRKLESLNKKLNQQDSAIGQKLPFDFEKVSRNKLRKERNKMLRKSLQQKPKAISPAKERRGVKVLGIILGCFTICWTPFFIMYLVKQFCVKCVINRHIEQFITWLGYSNSAMNPIIYTVFNRDYQNALKRLFDKRKSSKNNPFPQILPPKKDNERKNKILKEKSTLTKTQSSRPRVN